MCCCSKFKQSVFQFPLWLLKIKQYSSSIARESRSNTAQQTLKFNFLLFFLFPALLSILLRQLSSLMCVCAYSLQSHHRSHLACTLHQALRLETKSGNEKKKEVIGNRYAMGTMMKNRLQYILPTRRWTKEKESCWSIIHSPFQYACTRL